jgi:hypothetical protein
VQTPTKSRKQAIAYAMMIALIVSPVIGCGEPSARELKNRQEFEALLTAIVLKNSKELELDAKRIADRHASGELSDASHADLLELVKLARNGDWAVAEKRAYEFREQRPYFK